MKKFNEVMLSIYWIIMICVGIGYAIWAAGLWVKTKISESKPCRCKIERCYDCDEEPEFEDPEEE